MFVSITSLTGTRPTALLCTAGNAYALHIAMYHFLPPLSLSKGSTSSPFGARASAIQSRTLTPPRLATAFDIPLLGLVAIPVLEFAAIYTVVEEIRFRLYPAVLDNRRSSKGAGTLNSLSEPAQTH